MRWRPSRLMVADTIGAANPRAVSSLVSELVAQHGSEVLGCHFHDTRAMAMTNVFAALEHDVRLFDSAIGGLGAVLCAGREGQFGDGRPRHLAREHGRQNGCEPRASPYRRYHRESTLGRR